MGEQSGEGTTDSAATMQRLAYASGRNAVVDQSIGPDARPRCCDAATMRARSCPMALLMSELCSPSIPCSASVAWLLSITTSLRLCRMLENTPNCAQYCADEFAVR